MTYMASRSHNHSQILLGAPVPTHGLSTTAIARSWIIVWSWLLSTSHLSHSVSFMQYLVHKFMLHSNVIRSLASIHAVFQISPGWQDMYIPIPGSLQRWRHLLPLKLWTILFLLVTWQSASFIRWKGCSSCRKSSLKCHWKSTTWWKRTHYVWSSRIWREESQLDCYLVSWRPLSNSRVFMSNAWMALPQVRQPCLSAGSS